VRWRGVGVATESGRKVRETDLPFDAVAARTGMRDATCHRDRTGELGMTGMPETYGEARATLLV
jgi:hypothetical protein